MLRVLNWTIPRETGRTDSGLAQAITASALMVGKPTLLLVAEKILQPARRHGNVSMRKQQYLGPQPISFVYSKTLARIKLRG